MIYNCKTTQEYNKEYIAKSVIGCGSFSEVILAEHRPSNCLRAVKIIKKCHLQQQHLDPIHLLKEVAILKQSDHPKLLKYFDLYTDELNYYLIAEYCEGSTLFNRIKLEKSFSENKAASIVYQILEGLLYLHEKDFIHRDIKCENIFFQSPESLTLKIADFGSSTILNRKLGAKGVYGTSHYLAPEVLKGNYDEKVDIWSLGITLYIMVKGKMPYLFRDADDVHDAIINTPFKIEKNELSEYSEELVDFLEGLLKINPTKRFSANEALQHPWLSSRESMIVSA